MNSQSRKSIPIEERFQHGWISSIEKDICHVTLDQGCKWTGRARIRLDRLPAGKTFADYAEDDQVNVFLLVPVHESPDSMHGSLAWAERENNPWYTDPPLPGKLYHATAIQYLDSRGVFVRLDNGIDSLLRSNEVPMAHDDITEVIDIGDRLAVQILAVRKDVLEAPCSIIKALETLRSEEQRKRTQELFSEETVKLLSKQEYSLPVVPEIRLVVLGPDQFFSKHLVRWLNSLGYFSVAAQTINQVADMLQAVNHPTHIVCTVAAWPTGQNEQRMLAALLVSKNIKLIWMKDHQQHIQSNNLTAPELNLPLNVGELIRWLHDPAYQPAQKKKTNRFYFTDYRMQHVQRLSSRLLEDICREHNLEAALWVRRERKGVYFPRAYYGLHEDMLVHSQFDIGQSLIATCIEQNEWITRPVYNAGPLKLLAPVNADQICCMPLVYKPLDSEEDVSRAVVFFYQQKKHPQSIHELIQPYIPAMQAMVETLHFASQNEMLSAFANLGINSAAYMHELGQIAQPVREMLDKQNPDGGLPDNKDWRLLKKTLEKLLRMTKTDLSVIQRQNSAQCQLQQRLTNIARLFTYRAENIGCSFRLIMPAHLMMMSIPALIFDQIMNNLLDNAYYFAAQLAKNTARIEVKVSFDVKEPNYPLRIDVIDNGSGVRAAMREKIFMMRDSEKDSGTGMGLFIVKSFLHAIGGKIELHESIRWQHTVFRVSLPVCLDKQIQ